MGSRYFFAIVLAVLIGTVSSFAKDYYVSPSGDDSRDGSISRPWQHIAFATCGGSYACSCTVNNPNRITAGDTLFIREGKYSEHDIRMANTGTSAAWIVIKAYPDEKDTIDCQKISSGFNVGTFQTNNYIVMDGLFIKNPLQAGIRIGENYTGDHLIIKNCRFEGLVQNDNSACVFLSTSNDTRIDNCVMVGSDSTNLNYCGIQIFRGNGSDTIQHCDISHFAEGIFYKHCSLGYMQTVIRNNFIHDNHANGLWISSDQVLMQNNLVVNNGTSGVSIWEDAGGTGGSNSSVLHNTVYNQRYTMQMNWGGQYDTLTKDHGVRNDTLVNNIFYGNNGELGSYCVWAYAPDSAFTNNPPDDSSNYNCYYDTATSNVMRWQGTTYTLTNWRVTHPTLDANSIQGAPTFANVSGMMDSIKDFKLLSGNGYRAASDGMNMGANVDSVGLQGSQTTFISDPTRNNRRIFSQFGTQAHCSIFLETHRTALISGEQVYDIQGQQIRNNQVRPNGMYVSVKR